MIFLPFVLEFYVISQFFIFTSNAYGITCDSQKKRGVGDGKDSFKTGVQVANDIPPQHPPPPPPISCDQLQSNLKTTTNVQELKPSSMQSQQNVLGIPHKKNTKRREPRRHTLQNGIDNNIVSVFF